MEVTAKVTQYTALLIASMFCFKIASEISRIAFFLFYFAITLVCIQKYLQRVFIACCQKSINTKRLVILTMAENVEEIKTSWHGRDVELSFKRFDPAGCAGHSSWNRMLWHSDSGNYNNMYDCVTQRVVDEIFIHIPYSEGDSCCQGNRTV